MDKVEKVALELVVDNTAYMFGDEAIRLQRIPEYEPNKEDIVTLVAGHFGIPIISLLNDSRECKAPQTMLVGLLFERLQMSTSEIQLLLSVEVVKLIHDFYTTRENNSEFASMFVHLWLQAGTHPEFREC